MEIKVNDYVRDHINGIGKVIKSYDNELEIVFKKARVKTSVSSYFEFELNKSNSQIIDLIEVGDYVNGKEVIAVDTLTKQIIYEYGECDGFIEEKYIYSIVTKEMFEKMEYKLEKE